MFGYLSSTRISISTSALYVCLLLLAVVLSGKRELYHLPFYRASKSLQVPYLSPYSPNSTSDSLSSVPYPVVLNYSESQSVVHSVSPLPAPAVSIKLANVCNIYAGKWVKDDGYPLYKSGGCPYVDEAFSCQRNGRPDSQYQKWRWQPEGCDLPRFNGSDFLWRLRGKRLMLVGDSMNRNQFESLLCLLHAGLHDKTRMYEIRGYALTKGRGYFAFNFSDFNCTIEFVRSHFLVKEGIGIGRGGKSIPFLSIDKIDKSAGKWKKADVLVFNTGHWWTHGKTSRGKDYYKEGDYIYPRLDNAEAYRRAMRTWANWIDHNINPEKQLVFYRGYSSAHFRGGDWDSDGTCRGEKYPILGGRFMDDYPAKMKIFEDVIRREMRVPVILLNVTHLTNTRKDGHPSVYGKMVDPGSVKKPPSRRQDCSHWCLPGVPDAWNELLYAGLMLISSHSITN